MSIYHRIMGSRTDVCTGTAAVSTFGHYHDIKSWGGFESRRLFIMGGQTVGLSCVHLAAKDC